MLSFTNHVYAAAIGLMDDRLKNAGGADGSGGRTGDRNVLSGPVRWITAKHVALDCRSMAIGEDQMLPVDDVVTHPTADLALLTPVDERFFAPGQRSDVG